MADPPVGEVEMSPEELRGLLAEASAGRWVAGGEGRTSWVACRPTNGPTLTLADVDSSADAALIVAVVNSLPALIASVDRVQELTRENERLRAALRLAEEAVGWHGNCATCQVADEAINAALNPAGSDA